MSETLLTPALDFFVEGTPAPGGSKNAFIPRRKDGSIVMRVGTNSPVVNMVDAGKRNKEWRKCVAHQARAYAPHSQISDRPLGVQFNFLMPRPKSHYGKGRNSAVLCEDAPKFHGSKPDVLKLARSTEDALTGIIWLDDCQTVALNATKRYAYLGEKAGCRVRVTIL